MQNSNRVDRFVGRAALRTVTKSTRCFDCGRRSVLPGGNVGIRKTEDGIVGYAGLFSCGSVWLCPVCNAKIMARRSIDVGAVLLWAQQQDFVVLWGALTIRHNAFTSLAGMIRMQRDAWRRVTQRREWTSWNATKTVPHVHDDERCDWRCNVGPTGHKNSVRPDHDGGCDFICPRLKDVIDTGKDGRVGYIRAAEINYGDVNGWHPHFHPIILIRGTTREAQWFADDVVAAWREAVEYLGGEAYIDGQSLRVISGVAIFDALTGYVTKSTFDHAKIAMEATWSQSKFGRGRVKETRSHWSLLVDIAAGLAEEAFRWEQLEEAAVGHRAITWSRGLREFAGLNRELTDEEIAEREVGKKEDTVVMLTARGWEGLRDRPEVVALMLDALEHGEDELRRVLDFYGVEYGSVDDLADLDGEQHAGFTADRKADEYEEWFIKVGDEPLYPPVQPESGPILVGSRGFLDPNEPMPATW